MRRLDLVGGGALRQIEDLICLLARHRVAGAAGAGALIRPPGSAAAPPVRRDAVEIGFEQLGRRLVLGAAFAPQRRELVWRELIEPPALMRAASDGAAPRAAVVIERHAQHVGLDLRDATGAGAAEGAEMLP